MGEIITKKYWINYLEIIGLEYKVDKTFEDFKKFIGCTGTIEEINEEIIE